MIASPAALINVQRERLNRAQGPLASPFSKYENDAIGFIDENLGAHLWETPRAILTALTQPRARIAVKGCHRSSKTWTMGRAVAWFVATGGRVVTTAPSGDQVELIWREIREAFAKSKYRLPGEILTHEWKNGRETLALGRSTDRAERFQGGNLEKLLLVVDEAPGVRGAIFEGIEGMRSGGDVRVVLLGNPTLLGGQFHDAFTAERETWQTFTIDAFETPNLAGLTEADVLRMTPEELDARIVRPYLITGRWVQEKLRAWGPDDPRYQSRVRGQFPTQSKSSVYPLAWADWSKSRTEDKDGKPLDLTGKLYAGIDPAGEGSDEFAVYVRRGCEILNHAAWTDGTAWESCDRLLAESGGPGAFAAVTVDSDGIGYGYAKRLKDAGYKVVFAHAQESANDRKRFDRCKDEWHWLLRERMERGMLTGLTDETTKAQLSKIRWELGPMGWTVVESKAKMRARGVKSPDRAEALMLAFVPEKPGGVRVYVSG